LQRMKKTLKCQRHYYLSKIYVKVSLKCVSIHLKYANIHPKFVA
jgi:hypothetical protein